MTRLAAGLAAAILVACGSPRAVPAPRSPPAPSPPRAASTATVPPEGTAPSIPDGEPGQRDLLAEIDRACDLVSPLADSPPDVGERRCLDRFQICLSHLPTLELLAHSRFVDVRGETLVKAAMMFHLHGCAMPEAMHPCTQERATVQGTACGSLAWLPSTLVEALRAPEPSLRDRALDGLMNVRLPADVLVPAATSIFRDYRPGPEGEPLEPVVNIVLVALRDAGAEASGIAPALDRLLQDRPHHDPYLVSNALGVVAGLGLVAPESLERRVVEALGDRRPSVRLAALEALEHHADHEDLAAVEPLASDPDPAVRRAAEELQRRLTAPLDHGR